MLGFVGWVQMWGASICGIVRPFPNVKGWGELSLPPQSLGWSSGSFHLPYLTWQVPFCDSGLQIGNGHCGSLHLQAAGNSNGRVGTGERARQFFLSFPRSSPMPAPLE